MGITNTRLNLANSVARYKGEREAKLAEIARIEAGVETLPLLRERITTLDGLIAAAELIVREDHPGWSADSVQPRRTTNHQSAIPYGQLGRTALDVLREGPPDGMHTREIASAVLRRFGLDHEDRALLDKTANSLGNYLKGNEGDLVESNGEHFYRKWKVIRPAAKSYVPTS